MNCLRPAPISIATVGTIQIVNNLSTLVLAKMFGASRAYADRATAVWHGSHAHLETHGLDAEGRVLRRAAHGHVLRRRAARARSRDGVDLGGEIPNVVSRWANVESQELDTPLRYLYRRAVPDSGGPGKYRGGVCHEYAFTPSGDRRNPMGLVLFGKGTRAPMSLGLFGGYPGCNVGYSTFAAANVDELPGRLEEITRRRAGGPVFWGHVELEPRRRPVRPLHGRRRLRRPDRPRPGARRARRRRRASSTVEAARAIYGVVLGRCARPPTTRGASRSRRSGSGEAIRSPTAGPAATGASALRVPPAGKRRLDTVHVLRGPRSPPPGADWKEHAALAGCPSTTAGPLRTPAGEFFLIRRAARVRDAPRHRRRPRRRPAAARPHRGTGPA